MIIKVDFMLFCLTFDRNVTSVLKAMFSPNHFSVDSTDKTKTKFSMENEDQRRYFPSQEALIDR